MRQMIRDEDLKTTEAYSVPILEAEIWAEVGLDHTLSIGLEIYLSPLVLAPGLVVVPQHVDLHLYFLWEDNHQM